MIRVALLLCALLLACGATASSPSDAGTTCLTASDCHGPLPEIACQQCPDGGAGCPRWVCVSGQCEIASGCASGAGP